MNLAFGEALVRCWGSSAVLVHMGALPQEKYPDRKCGACCGCEGSASKFVETIV